MVENEPWLFGEEVATHVSDKSLTALLGAHLGLLGREDCVSEAVTDADGKPRRIDFLFGRALELNRARREHLVVDIKRPSITIDRAEMDQLEDYARAVIADTRFDLAAIQTHFVIRATDMADRTQGRTHRQSQNRGLVYSTP